MTTRGDGDGERQRKRRQKGAEERVDGGREMTANVYVRASQCVCVWMRQRDPRHQLFDRWPPSPQQPPSNMHIPSCFSLATGMLSHAAASDAGAASAAAARSPSGIHTHRLVRHHPFFLFPSAFFPSSSPPHAHGLLCVRCSCWLASVCVCERT